MTGSLDQKSVAVLGCGNLGSAMVRALLSSGWQVTAWNPTGMRAEALAPNGANVAATAQEALTATPLAILCVSTTEDARGLLEAVDPADLGGTTILNTTSGTPEDTRAFSGWAQAHGVRYLDAAIGAYPEQLGTESARLLVAGDEELWKAHQAAIIDLAGSSMYVGTDRSAANALDCAMTGAFYITTLAAFLEAARFTAKFGVTHDVLSDLVGYSLEVMDVQLKHVLGRIRDNDFTTDQATLNVYAHAAEAFAAGLGAHGDAPMVQTTARVLRHGVDAGLGDLDIAAVFTLES